MVMSELMMTISEGKAYWWLHRLLIDRFASAARSGNAVLMNEPGDTWSEPFDDVINYV